MKSTREELIRMDVAALKAEIERLTAQLSVAARANEQNLQEWRDLTTLLEQQNKRAVAAEAKVADLQEALERIRDTFGKTGDFYQGIARAALSHQEDQPASSKETTR
jgi:dynactin complex subunit